MASREFLCLHAGAGMLAAAIRHSARIRGELRVLVYTEPTPGPDVEPVMVRSVMLACRG